MLISDDPGLTRETSKTNICAVPSPRLFALINTLQSQFDSWTLSWPAIGQCDSAFTNHWTVGHSTVQPLDSLTQHYLTLGKLHTRLSDHWTVGKITFRPLDCWTLISQAIGQLNTAEPTIGLLDTSLSTYWTVWKNIVWQVSNHWHVGHSTV